MTFSGTPCTSVSGKVTLEFLARESSKPGEPSLGMEFGPFRQFFTIFFFLFCRHVRNGEIFRDKLKKHPPDARSPAGSQTGSSPHRGRCDVLYSAGSCSAGRSGDICAAGPYSR